MGKHESHIFGCDNSKNWNSQNMELSNSAGLKATPIFTMTLIYRQSPIFCMANKKYFLVTKCKYGNFSSFLDILSPLWSKSFPIRQNWQWSFNLPFWKIKCVNFFNQVFYILTSGTFLVNKIVFKYEVNSCAFIEKVCSGNKSNNEFTNLNCGMINIIKTTTEWNLSNHVPWKQIP